MQRYFIDNCYSAIEFNKEQSNHILKVMRMDVGDELEVVFNKKCYVCEIVNIKPLLVDIKREIVTSPELNIGITLFYCLPKGDKLDLVIQKATEIGVREIVLVQSSRCVCKYKKDDFNKKLNRFNKIAVEASEQSHRFIVPLIKDIIDFEDIKNYDFDYKYIAYENERDFTFTKDLENIDHGQTIGIIVGSEGGFSEAEVRYANEVGYKSISLGKRILRSETACIYALSVISYLVENV